MKLGLVPSAYKAPYRIKGYQPYPDPPKPPTIPDDLRKSIEYERRASQGDQPSKEEVINSLPTNLDQILLEDSCRIVHSEDRNQCPVSKCSKSLTNPPPGITKHYWRLKQEHYGRPPTGSKFRSARFIIQEKLEPKSDIEFPLYESASTYEVPQWTYKPKKVPFHLSERQKRAEIRKWGGSIKTSLGDFQRSREEWARRSDDIGFIPQDRVNFGCERIRGLAEINANIVFLLVKKFVTGAPHKDIHWLNRTEAVDCWDRIVGKTRSVKNCCVDAPLPPRTIPVIPSLKSPRKKGQETLDKSVSIKKNKKPLRSKPSKGPKLPPFCQPIPPPELRLPWHIPPLKPRDGDDRRKKIVFDRNIDLDFIIKPFTDPYGEDRRKQRAARTKALRQAMTNDFFKRTDMDSHLNELDLILIHAQQNYDGTPKARRDLMLAQILAKNDFENTAERMREREAESERQERIAARNAVPDFSHVSSRYMDIGKHKSRGVAGVL